MEKLYTIAYELHDMLFNSDEYHLLKKYEKIMMDDEKLKPIFKEYKSAQEKYSYDKSEESLKKIHEIKLIIDLNEKVINYQKAFKKYQILLTKITDIAFKDLILQDDIIKKIRVL